MTTLILKPQSELLRVSERNLLNEERLRVWRARWAAFQRREQTKKPLTRIDELVFADSLE